MSIRTIAIIGGGFSGTAMALNLLRRTGPSTRIALIERGAAFGLGTAYSTTDPNHLLNVPASRMSAFASQPDHFLNWLQTRPDAPPGDGFKPRKLFGAYVRELLEQGCRTANGRLRLVRGDVVRVSEGASLILTLDDGETISADVAVLAVGNFEPAPVLPGDAAYSPCYCGNPWARDAAAELDPDAPVLLIGTGLTMVDTVVTLLDAGHRGVIHALSRRGLSPQRHVAAPAAPLPPVPDYPATMLALLRCLRADAAACVAAGGTWQQALDRFRPFTQPVWISASFAERAAFLRHVRPWWDIHRHRIAGAITDRIDAARMRSQLQIVAGRIQAATERQGALDVQYAPRGGGALRSIRAARVINCTGPACDYRRSADPLIRSLLRDGLARPDRLHLSLDVTVGGAVVGRNGTVSQRLFAIGPTTRGTFWESTAVPDIRQHCEALASHIAERVKEASAPARPARAAPIWLGV